MIIGRALAFYWPYIPLLMPSDCLYYIGCMVNTKFALYIYYLALPYTVNKLIFLCWFS